MATAEAAIALAALVAVVVLGIGALLAVSAQVRCVDAAREAARLAARGDTAEAVTAGSRVAPPGARVELRTEGDLVVADVSAPAILLPLTLHAAAVAVREPGEPR
ncbi:TadE family type IV pilus minor pilin [Nocardia concava]|uniref:TadE family type IV pilus minor pilin n=1 Tax=Nocardia concava TaxID=257281 RepID=UPI0002F957D9|nr:TadE family type IV pilus minor pilin [Nocardia concava]